MIFPCAGNGKFVRNGTRLNRYRKNFPFLIYRSGAKTQAKYRPEKAAVASARLFKASFESMRVRFWCFSLFQGFGAGLAGFFFVVCGVIIETNQRARQRRRHFFLPPSSLLSSFLGGVEPLSWAILRCYSSSPCTFSSFCIFSLIVQQQRQHYLQQHQLDKF
jgi:hypothetical protein